MIRKSGCIYCFIVLFIFNLNSVLYAEQIPGFQQIEIALDGTIQHVYTGDYNGDTLEDLCLFVNRQNASGFTQRQLQIYYQDPGTLFNNYDVCLNLSKETVALDFGDLNGDGIIQPVLLMDNGIFVWDVGSSNPLTLIPLISEDHSLYAPHPLSLFKIPFLIKHNQKVSKILWSTTHQNRFYEFCDTSYVLKETLPRIPGQTLQDGLMRYPIPQIMLSRNSNTMQFDIWDHSQNTIHIYSLHDSSKKISDYRFWQVGHSFEDRSIQALQSSQMDLTILDLNADEQLDVIAVQSVRGGVTSHISHMQFYYNQSGYLPENPDNIILTENVHGEHLFCNLNHDSYPDLLVFNLNISIFQAMRFLLTGKVTVGFDVYINQPETGFLKKPDQTITWHLPVSLDQLIITPYKAFTVDSDLNGDGHHDLFAKIDTEIYMMVPGSSTGHFKLDQKQYYHIPGKTQFHLKDFNGDQRDDILFYSDEAHSNHKLVLYLSQ